MLARAVDGLIAVDTPCDRPLPVPVVAVSGHRHTDGVTNIVLNHERAAARRARAPARARPQAHRVHQGTGVQLGHRRPLAHHPRAARSARPDGRSGARHAARRRRSVARSRLHHHARCWSAAASSRRCSPSTTSRRSARSARCAKRAAACPRTSRSSASTTSRAPDYQNPGADDGAAAAAADGRTGGAEPAQTRRTTQRRRLSAHGVGRSRVDRPRHHAARAGRAPPRKVGILSDVPRKPSKPSPPNLPLLKDRIRPGVRVLLVGINPGVRSALTGHHFAGYSNRFWKLLAESGLVPVPITYQDDDRLPEWGFGLTNLVPRPTRGIDELTALGIRRRTPRPRTQNPPLRPAHRRAHRPHAGAVAAARDAAAGRHARRTPDARRAAAVEASKERRDPASTPDIGLQSVLLAGAPVFVLPNPSGRNAHYSYSDMLDAFRELKRYVDSLPKPAAAAAAAAAASSRSPNRSSKRARKTSMMTRIRTERTPASITPRRRTR